MAEEPEIFECYPKQHAATFAQPTDEHHIIDLLGIDKDHEDANEQPFLVNDPQLIFHPTSTLNEFEDELEEEMIKIVNPNKHVQNYEDGGRRRKLRHVSKIECFKRGKDAINPFCKDLFGVKQTIDPTPQKDADQDFSQILEERHEESPPVTKTDQSMQSGSKTS